ncbi:protein of unknown function [Lutibacter oricola]|uniref:DUF4296 domain-containing protein n=1 Tax=Lutibacter oricola TaxID=762486 RepID=A0A1H2RBY6_9FLAO|nr:DUF4296 domain-containing protein [Lutibacter oricola]SDW16169.1 protein of unknown function [Lutibacter oricola]
MKTLLKFIILILTCSLLTFCTSNTIYKKPDNLIAKDQMVSIVTDMLMATGGNNIKNLNLERKVNYFPLIFEKYKIDSTAFNASNVYYTSRIDDYSDILKEVSERLEQKKEIFKSELKVRDSLKRIERKAKTISKDSIIKDFK